MAARRCRTCCISWPLAIDYNTCPACQEGTQRRDSLDPDMGMNEAREMKTAFEWHRFYDSWDSGGWFASFKSGDIDAFLTRVLTTERPKLRSVDDLIEAVLSPSG